jgi:hypothetical protein
MPAPTASVGSDAMPAFRRRPGPPRLETFQNADHRAAVEILRELGSAHKAVLESSAAFKRRPTIANGEALVAALDGWVAIRRRMRAHARAKINPV